MDINRVNKIKEKLEEVEKIICLMEKGKVEIDISGGSVILKITIYDAGGLTQFVDSV